MHAVMAPSAHQQLAPVRTRQGAATTPWAAHVSMSGGGGGSVFKMHAVMCQPPAAGTCSQWEPPTKEGNERDTLSCLAG